MLAKEKVQHLLQEAQMIAQLLQSPSLATGVRLQDWPGSKRRLLSEYHYTVIDNLKHARAILVQIQTKPEEIVHNKIKEAALKEVETIYADIEAMEVCAAELDKLKIQQKGSEKQCVEEVAIFANLFQEVPKKMKEHLDLAQKMSQEAAATYKFLDPHTALPKLENALSTIFAQEIKKTISDMEVCLREMEMDVNALANNDAKKKALEEIQAIKDTVMSKVKKMEIEIDGFTMGIKQIITEKQAEKAKESMKLMNQGICMAVLEDLNKTKKIAEKYQKGEDCNLFFYLPNGEVLTHKDFANQLNLMIDTIAQEANKGLEGELFDLNAVKKALLDYYLFIPKGDFNISHSHAMCFDSHALDTLKFCANEISSDMPKKTLMNIIRSALDYAGYAITHVLVKQKMEAPLHQKQGLKMQAYG